MTLSVYEAATIPCTQALGAMKGVLGKAASHVEARKLDAAALLGFRLYPDMFPLTRQVQIASDIAKGGCARLAGVEPPSYPDSETSFAQLQERLDTTLSFIAGLTEAQFQGAEDRQVTLKMRDRSVQFVGRDYLFQFVYPNLYFHCATAYDILRHNGVELGKRDFLGVVPAMG